MIDVMYIGLEKSMLVPPRQKLHSHFHWSVVGFPVKDSRGRQEIMSVSRVKL